MEEIRQILLNHPLWNEFTNNYEGRNFLMVNFRGVDFIMFNEVGEHLFVTVTIESLPLTPEREEMVREFQRTAIELFQNAVNLRR